MDYVRNFTDTELAWAAGFMEGEGCFGYYGGRRTRNGKTTGRTKALVIMAVQKDREPLDKLLGIIKGGFISYYPDRWEWRVNGHLAAPIMEIFLPHMSVRRQEAIRNSLSQHYSKQAEIEARKNSPVCNKGHLWSKEAGFVTKGPQKGNRYCKACSRERMRTKRTEKIISNAKTRDLSPS